MANQLNNLGSTDAVYLEMDEAADQHVAAHGHNLEGDINISVVVGYLDRQISLVHAAYANRSADIYKWLNIYVAIQGAVLTSLFSIKAWPTGCSKGWWTTPLILSAITSATVIYAVLRKFVQQFHLFKRGRQLQEERRNFLVDIFLYQHGITLTIMNRFVVFNYNRGSFVCPEAADRISGKYHNWWIAERAVFLGFLITFSLYLLLSCSCSQLL